MRKFLNNLNKAAAAVTALIMAATAVPTAVFADSENNSAPISAETALEDVLSQKPVGGLAESYGIPLESKEDQALNGTAVPYAAAPSTIPQLHEYSSDVGYKLLADMENGEVLQEVYLKIYSALLNVYLYNTEEIPISNITAAAEVSFDGLLLTSSEMSLIHQLMLLCNPQFYWLSNYYYYYADGDKISTYIPTFVDEYAEPEARAAFDDVVEQKVLEYADETKGLDSDYEKVEAVYTKLLNEVEYAYVEGTTTPDYTKASVHSVAGAIAGDKKVVCDGYSLTLSLVLNYLDIDNLVVIGNAVQGEHVEGHAWNAVLLDDGNFYWFDATWDDIGEISPDNYDYFALTDELFSYTHKAYDKIYDQSDIFVMPVVEISDKPFDLSSLNRGSETGEIFSLNGLSYKIYNDMTCAVISSSGNVENVEIPSLANGYKVVEIAAGAFSRDYKVKTVTIPASVEVIREGAFEYCTSLESVTIKQGCKYIEDNAFSGCLSLASFTAPSGLKSIGNEAFLNCTALKTVTLPNSISYIGSEAFVNTGCTYYEISGTGEHYTSADGVIYSSRMTALAFYPPCYAEDSFDIPSSIIEIGSSAFQGSTLNSIDIGGNVYKISRSAFEGSTLKNVDITSSVKAILDYAFYNCRDIKIIKVADSVISIGINALGIVYDLDKMADSVNTNAYIWCNDNSYARAYAEAYKLNYLNYDGTHKHNYVSTVYEPSYATNGYTYHECTICGDFYTDSVVNKLTVGNTQMTVTAVTDSTASVSWTAVNNADGYELYKYTNGSWQKILTTSGTTANITSLGAGTTNSFAVRAYVIEKGVIYYSTEYAVAAVKTVPVAPTPTVTSRSKSSIKISWNEVEGADGYQVLILKNGKWNSKILSNTTTSYTFKNLKSATDYKVTVKAYVTVNGKRYVSGRTILTSSTTPTAPTPKVASRSKSSIKISWNKVSGADGYQVLILKNGKWNAKNLSNTTTSYTFKNLKSATDYKVTVKAYVVENGKKYVSGRTILTASTTPTAPTPKIVSRNRNSVKISWNKVTGADGYQVLILKNGKWNSKILSKNTTSYTFKNLKANTNYKVTVKAYVVENGKKYVSGRTILNAKTTA